MKTKALTEGAMLSALMVLMVYVGIHIGFIGIIVPVPLAVLVLRHGFKAGLVVAFVSSIVSSLVLGSILLSLELILIGILGIALGMAIREGFTITQTFFVGMGAALVSIGLKILTYSAITGMNLLEMYLEMWDTTSNQWMRIWEGLNLPEEAILEYASMLEAIPVLVQMLLPSLLLGMAVVQAFVTLLVLRLILKRLGTTIPWFPPFSHWRFPWHLVWGFILGRLIGVLTLFHPHLILTRIGANLDMIFLYVFFIQGLAIVWFFFDRFKIPKVFRILFVIFLFQPGLFGTLVALFGVLDIWVDFRKLNAKEVP